MTTHFALSSLCLSALLVASVANAQPVPEPTVTAAEQAVKLQVRVIECRNRLADGRAAEARRETLAASQHYNKALELLQGVGTTADPERQQAVEGLSRTTLTLADQSMKRAEYTDAKPLIDRVIKVDPNNKMALDMRALNDRMIAETYSLTPHKLATDKLDSFETNRVESSKLVQDGKLFYESGQFKEAEVVLSQALRLNPNDKAATYYLELVSGAKYQIEARVREVNSKEMLLKVEEEWIAPITRKALDSPNAYARTNLVFTSDRRQAIYAKLRRIKLSEWGPIDNLPLSEVIRGLNDEASRRDPEARVEAKGINLIISPNADAGAGGGAAGGVDPLGLPVAAAGPSDLNGVTIRLGTKLKDLSLEDVLNIIEKIADQKIKYSVEDYGIIISPRANEPQPLHTRIFHIDPNTFQQGLQNVQAASFGESQGGGGGGGGGGSSRGGGGGSSRGGGGGGNRGGGNNNNNGGGNNGGNSSGGGSSYGSVSLVGGGTQGGGARQGGARQGVGGQQAGGAAGAAGQGGISFLSEVTLSETVIPTVKAFFTAAGVSLIEPGKAVFYNDRLGVLMVRATLGDLDIIEKAMQVLNMAPPQVMIRAKFMEVTQDDTRALGFDWYLGNTLANNGSIGVQGGSAPSLAAPGSGSIRNPGGFFPGQSGTPGTVGPSGIAGSATDELVTSGLRNSAPALASVTGILTDPQFRLVIRALEQRGGTDLLSAPEVTTMSGRQAQFKAVDIRYIVTDLELDQTGGGGNGNNGGNGTTVNTVGSTVQPLAEPFELGPVLDVVPYVNADGFTIQMTILPTLKEFLGYDDPGQFVAQAQGGATGASALAPTPTPLPKFRLRQVATTAMVWDGQTVVLGGLIAENVTKMKDKVPVLGDLPFLGRFFRSEANMTSKKNLVIFVTPRLIDPAGNPLHSEEEMPFGTHGAAAQTKTGTIRSAGM